MKLLIFIYSLSSGGTERVVSNLGNYWAKKGWQITIVTMVGVDQDFYQLHPDINRIVLSFNAHNQNILTAIKNNYNRIRALHKILKQQQPDIALAMMTTANVLLVLASKGLGIPIIGSERVHPPMFAIGQIWKWLRKQSYGQLDAVVVLVEKSAQWIKSHTKAQQIKIIPNAINYPIISNTPTIKPNKSDNAFFNLIAVGRLSHQKGFDRLILAFSALSARFPKWNLTILGEGDCRESLERQRNQLRLKHRICLNGIVGNLSDWYKWADLFVITSRFEGFPNTLLEAMSYGLPVVGVDCDTGPRDIIRNQIDGLLVSQNNHKELVNALAILMSNEALRRQYSSRAIEIRERFSMAKITGMWEELFKIVSKK